jgi:hypothetical protein
VAELWNAVLVFSERVVILWVKVILSDLLRYCIVSFIHLLFSLCDAVAETGKLSFVIFLSLIFYKIKCESNFSNNKIFKNMRAVEEVE